MIVANMSEIDRLNRALRLYARLRLKLDIDAILEKKGNDLRIQLGRLFMRQKAKKAALTAKRIGAWGGVNVRQTFIDREVPTVDKNGKPLSFWQRLVAQELMRRQRGIGVLGTGFFGSRWRYNRGGPYLVENKSRALGTMVESQKSRGRFRITGFTPGLRAVADKYGILDKALRRVTWDIEKYIRRKLGDGFEATLNKA